MKLEHFLNIIHKNILKMGYRSKCKTRNYKTPRGNIGRTLSDINHRRILYDPPPRLMEIKAKINKWDIIKLKSFCTTKETISKLKRQPSEWEKIIADENDCNDVPSHAIRISSIPPLSHLQLFVTHGLQHARLPCPSLTPRAYSNACLSSR